MSNLFSWGVRAFWESINSEEASLFPAHFVPHPSQGDLVGAALPIPVCPMGGYLQVQHNPLSQAPDWEVVNVEVEHHLERQARQHLVS